MLHFFCWNSDNRIIGHVWAFDGDDAWALARLVEPAVNRLSPALN